MPNSTKEISDLKTGTAWLRLLNKMFNRNYKSGNPRKNYNNCIKMLQANDIDVDNILESLDKLLEGDEETHIDIADSFREVLINCDDLNDTATYSEIETKLEENRKLRSLKENKKKSM